MLLNLIIFILILSILVFVHELGHFAVAKWTGMRVDEFGIGFPPRMFTRKKGDTLYSLNWVPLGGFVKIHGENPEQIDDEPGSFQKKSVWSRMAVICAGVFMNLLFAFAVLTLAFSTFGFISVSQDASAIPGAVIKNSQVMVVEVQADSPAAKAGIKDADLIKSVSDSSGKVVVLHTLTELQNYTKAHQTAGDLKIKVLVDRQGNESTQNVTLSSTGVPLGVAIDAFNTVRLPFWQSVKTSYGEIKYIIQVTWDALKGFGQSLFVQHKLDQNVSGPVGIYQATSNAAREGAIPTIFLMVALSINLALLNILPIPGLDGGKLLFLLTELIFRKRVIAEKVENSLALAGLGMLLILVFIVTIKDVIKLF